jgi:hypothetical protein
VRSIRRTPLVATLMAIFLAAHLTCVCAGPAIATAMAIPSGTPTRTADPHACCHRTGESAPTPVHAPPQTCQHCTHAHLTAPDAVKLAGPIVQALPSFLAAAPAPVALADSGPCRSLVRACNGHAPPLERLRTRVLLL